MVRPNYSGWDYLENPPLLYPPPLRGEESDAQFIYPPPLVGGGGEEGDFHNSREARRAMRS
jgi:hypothetical protein